jgi:adenosylcobinamide-GDP ribazoletransferase
MMGILHELLLAFQFMTRIPIRSLPHRPGALARAAKFFPVVGLVIGLVASGIHHVLLPYVSGRILAITLLSYLILITGALHEDGLADSADGFVGGWSKQQVLEIMHDSRIGTYGAIAIVLSLLWRFVLITNVAPARLPAILVAGSVLCRWTSLPLGFFLPYARAEDGVGGYIAGRLPISSFLWGTFFALLSVGAVLRRASLWPWLITIAITLASAFYFRRRIQGVTGDCFGAVNQVTEIAIYAFGALHS